MAIFISYSQEDSDFVDILAANLVRAKHHIWMDRWELNLGDSLTAKIEESLTDSSAILFILSKSSVASEWCRRELNAGLIRELEERRTLVMPIVIEDCDIPLFLKYKLYADFRKGPDKAFNLIDRSLAKFSNPTTSRAESPDFHTDFALVWKKKDIENSEETWIIRWTFVDHGAKQPYVIVSECKVYAVDDSEYLRSLSSDKVMDFIKEVTIALYNKYMKNGVEPIIISDNTEAFVGWTAKIASGSEYLCLYSYRRLGADNGMDTVIYPDNNLKMVVEHLEKTVRRS